MSGIRLFEPRTALVVGPFAIVLIGKKVVATFDSWRQPS